MQTEENVCNHIVIIKLKQNEKKNIIACRGPFRFLAHHGTAPVVMVCLWIGSSSLITNKSRFTVRLQIISLTSKLPCYLFLYALRRFVYTDRGCSQSNKKPKMTFNSYVPISPSSMGTFVTQGTTHWLPRARSHGDKNTMTNTNDKNGRVWKCVTWRESILHTRSYTHRHRGNDDTISSLNESVHAKTNPLC